MESSVLDKNEVRKISNSSYDHYRDLTVRAWEAAPQVNRSNAFWGRVFVNLMNARKALKFLESIQLEINPIDKSGEIDKELLYFHRKLKLSETDLKKIAISLNFLGPRAVEIKELIEKIICNISDTKNLIEHFRIVIRETDASDSQKFGPFTSADDLLKSLNKK